MIRPMRIDDVEKVYAIDQEVLKSNWTDVHYRFELLDINSRAYVYEIADEVVGFVIAKYMGESSDLIQLALKRDHQGKKIGAALLQYIIQKLKEEGVQSMILEVDANKRSIIHFYEQFNFQYVNLRRNYYGRNRHAVLMKLEVL